MRLPPTSDYSGSPSHRAGCFTQVSGNGPISRWGSYAGSSQQALSPPTSGLVQADPVLQQQQQLLHDAENKCSFLAAQVSSLTASQDAVVKQNAQLAAELSQMTFQHGELSARAAGFVEATDFMRAQDDLTRCSEERDQLQKENDEARHMLDQMHHQLQEAHDSGQSLQAQLASMAATQKMSKQHLGFK